MAYIYFSNNPRGRHNVGDCSIRAISKALNIPWESVYLDLAMEGYDLGDMPSSNVVINSYLRSRGFSRNTIDDLCPTCYTISDFANEHFRGIYILGTGSHLVTVIDGDYYDSWDSGEEIPIYYWSKER